MAEETAVEQQTPETIPAESPSFEQFSKERSEGKWNQPTEEARKPDVTPPRDSTTGRFSKVRESLRQSEIKASYVKGVMEGHIEPTEEMDADSWRAAREAQIRAGANKISTPEELLKPEKPASTEQNTEAGNAEQLSPERAEGFRKYDEFMTRVAAKVTIDAETRTALDGFSTAINRGALPDAVKYMAICLSSMPNSETVFRALGGNPDAIALYSRLSPEGMEGTIRALSAELAAQEEAKKAQVPARAKPAPPAPVGARASASVFDVNDESIDADTWAKQRNKQLAERRR